MAVKPPKATYTAEGPLGTTPYGSKVEVVRTTGCGGAIVRRVSDGESFPCHLSALTGCTPADQSRLYLLMAGSEVAA